MLERKTGNEMAFAELRYKSGSWAFFPPTCFNHPGSVKVVKVVVLVQYIDKAVEVSTIS